MPKIGEFIARLEPVTPSTPGAEVYDRFLTEPNTLAIAVVDDDLRPVGLIERNAFILKMAAEFGRALYARRPIATLMDDAPALADADAEADLFFDESGQADFADLLHGFIAVRDGRYVGIGTALQILQAGSALHRQRVQAMSRLNADLAEAEAKARASSRAKSEFLAVMSHEIRTPLNGVLGVAQLIEKKLEQDELRPYVQTVIESGESLLRLLNDALDLSRAEARGIELDPAPFALDELGRDLECLWRPRAEEKNITLSVRVESDQETRLVGDAVRLKQVLNNLVGNALKFTMAGSVTARLRVEDTAEGIRLHGEVADTGPGIPRNQVEHIFEPFRTGEAKRGGAGLGLAICRQIVESMGGTLALAPPELGQGAVFRFAVTLERADEGHDRTMAEPTPHDTLHILVVDDNATNRFVAAKLLETFGCSSETAENGAEAVEVGRASRFDLILMDIKMPVMGGVEATRCLRAAGYAGPIVALTANADEADQRTYLAAGMDSVVAKPIRPDLLLDAIRRAMTPVAAASAA
ncbi:ATP-binding protein [Brevundimonas lutea]|uniref:ATP-binding protein n=1 Tax=Brevundimonas lutea TaxID=2293980 RepID=UPI000F038CE0|nr:ATP-binding protein [Brevundimonas lutea]